MHIVSDYSNAKFFHFHIEFFGNGAEKEELISFSGWFLSVKMSLWKMFLQDMQDWKMILERPAHSQIIGSDHLSIQSGTNEPAVFF